MRTTVLGKLLLALFPVIVFVPLFIGSRLLFNAARGWTDWLLVFASAALVGFNPLVVNSTSSRKRWIILIAGFLGWVAFFVLLGFIIMAAVFHDAL